MKTGLRIIAILAIVGFVVAISVALVLWIKMPHLIKIARDVDEQRVMVKLEALAGAVFVTGMKACENLYVDPTSQRVYVTDLSGYVYLLDGASRENMKIVKSLKIGGFALGIDRGPDGWLYVAASDFDAKGWIEVGGAVFRLDMELERMSKLTGEYPALNGLAFDGDGRCYFASSNFSIVRPKGAVYMMPVQRNGAYENPQMFLPNVGLANGLHYDQQARQMYLSNTLEGVFTFQPGDYHLEELYRKTKYKEATDDLCTDSQGNLWMTDPFDSTLKMYDPRAKRLVRYVIEGVGQTSACDIRKENGAEIIYITEIRTQRDPTSTVYDGRGLVIVPLRSLTGLAREKASTR